MTAADCGCRFRLRLWTTCTATNRSNLFRLVRTVADQIISCHRGAAPLPVSRVTGRPHPLLSNNHPGLLQLHCGPPPLTSLSGSGVSICIRRDTCPPCCNLCSQPSAEGDRYWGTCPLLATLAGHGQLAQSALARKCQIKVTTPSRGISFESSNDRQYFYRGEYHFSSVRWKMQNNSISPKLDLSAR